MALIVTSTMKHYQKFYCQLATTRNMIIKRHRSCGVYNNGYSERVLCEIERVSDNFSSRTGYDKPYLNKTIFALN